MSFKVTLGIMPDYTFDGNGLRLDGVTDGKPAEKGGLQSGDILVKMGDSKIENIQDYMKLLQQFNKGDKVDVFILRNGIMLQKQIEF
jgi:S1-C subfamily serine protease